MSPKIAICISTRNREESLYETIKSIYKFMPDDCIVMVVDDASDKEYAWPDYRFVERAGISRVKNKCLELAMSYETVEHIFLMDDDVIVLKLGWELPYINSGEHHLSATFHRPRRTVKNSIGVDLNIHYIPNGYCQYFTRQCIETVGGFDTKYNNKFEHCDLSRRIFNAGLTKHIYQDVINSSELIYCLDQDKAIQRSFTPKEMQQNLKDGYDYFRSQDKSKVFIPFIT